MKVLVALLTIELLLAFGALCDAPALGTVVPAATRALLLLGFLKGHEGVRVLLVIGAYVGLASGLFGVLAASGLIAMAGAAALLVLALSTFSSFVFGYMVWALSQESTQHWMLERALGTDLDD